jgi:hypothetical protein
VSAVSFLGGCLGLHSRLDTREMPPMSLRFLNFIFLCLTLAACHNSGGGGGTPPDDDDDENDNPVSGLDSRPSNTTCLATNYNQPSEIELVPVLPSLDFSLPLLFLPHSLG